MGATAVAAVPEFTTTTPAPSEPTVVVHTEVLDCECYALHAAASGGRPPYRFEWGDGERGQARDLCDVPPNTSLSVVVVDATGVRSSAETVALGQAKPAHCDAMPPRTGVPPRLPELCLENLSFEGTPTPNLGQAGAFDAAPWSDCTNPPVRTNTPDIGNPSVAEWFRPLLGAAAPGPVDGMTSLALMEGEQVSQALCSEPEEGAPLSLELDIARIMVGTASADTEQVSLEVWGGQAHDCSRRELLWVSPRLEPAWQRFCVTLTPTSPMTQLTLRARASMTDRAPGYLTVDNLKPVDVCP
ncbi:MAG: hypothetical protein OXR73_14390 [Myxococcales bacterium]|nr:hypothetical protein [Myxococcales bacterium]